MVDTCVNHRLTCLCPKETEAAPLAWILRWLYLLECDSAHGIRPTPVAGPPTRLHGDRKYEEAPEEMLGRAAPGRVGPPRGRWRRRALCADDGPKTCSQIAVAGDLVKISRRCTPGLRSTFRPRVRGLTADVERPSAARLTSRDIVPSESRRSSMTRRPAVGVMPWSSCGESGRAVGLRCRSSARAADARSATT
jgi:hypothetical protein